MNKHVVLFLGGIFQLNKDKVALELSKLIGISNVKTDEPMKNHTSFKIGGSADVFVVPENVETLKKVYAYCKDNKIDVFILGNGTNIIVRDKGFRGVVIKILENMSNYEIKNDTIIAEAGILLSRLSHLAYENGLTGLEFAEGIPGTLGGAVTMNAGAYCGEMSFVVDSTQYIDIKGHEVILNKEQHEFGKRTSIIQSNGGVVFKSRIKLKKAIKSEIKMQMDKFKNERTEKQPLEMPSAGSVFKRPDGFFSGKLIQDCGLKGYTIGGAKVSEKHCGFIVNTKDASANDVINLIDYIKKTVKNKFGVELETEVKVIGEE